MQKTHGNLSSSLSPSGSPGHNNLACDPLSSSPVNSNKFRRFRLPTPDTMGQNESTLSSPPTTTQRFKRAFTPRRKKTADDLSDVVPSSPALTSSHAPSPVSRLFGYRKPSLLPPLPLTKPLALRSAQSPNTDDALIINSPGISASVQCRTESEESYFARPERKSVIDTEKEDWRKSDSTMASYHTIRATGNSSPRPRPVSVADSSHSSNTVMNKRLSMLVTDSELVSPQESDAGSEYVAVSRERPPPGALNASHRRSMSLNLGAALSFKKKRSTPELHVETPASVDSALSQSRSRELPVSYKSYTPALNRTAVNGFIAPSSTSKQPTGNQIQGRLAAWSATTASPQYNQTPPVAPPSAYSSQTNANPKASPPNFRQTTVSISGSIAPAAMDLGKRAMEKLGRAWGSRGTAAVSSGYMSSPGERTSLSLGRKRTNEPGVAMGKYNLSNDSFPSQISSLSSPGKSKRRTPNAPSGTWSLASSTSDGEWRPTLAGITSNRCMRGPLSAGGLVFGRRLEECVRDTAVDGVRLRLASGEYFSGEDSEDTRPLEERLLPAIVLRCVQHLLTWGIQEEGLFRVNGRSSHIKEMRREFDQGVDYDISECGPTDMDPHVVSSLFKLYLRELPEPLLTRKLMPYFDAVMSTEERQNPAKLANFPTRVGMTGPTLPSSPKPGMRKPPSLSTLSMPNLAAMRTVSQTTIRAIATLISRLPRENRDLLITLTDLMKATAGNFKQTKMPMANLLLVFCPSLNMKPSLLRILCESEDIWRCPPPRARESVLVEDDEMTVPIVDRESLHSRESSFDSIDDDPIPEGPPLRAVVGVRRGARRGPLATMYGALESSSSSSLSASATPEMASSDSMSYQDDSSDLSFSDVLPSDNSIARKPSRPLSSSYESLATPSTSCEGPAFMLTPAKEDMEGQLPPVIADDTLLPLHATPRASPPVPFPSAPRLSSRKSTPNLCRSGSTRMKNKPSINLLFGKRSESSLRSLSAASISAPILLSRPTSTTPPVIDTPISSSPIRFGFEGSVSGHKPELKVAPAMVRLRSTSSMATDSPNSAFYATPTGSFMSVSSDRTAEQESHDKMGMLRSASRLSVTLPSDDPDNDEDWMGSVLKAVDHHDR